MAITMKRLVDVKWTTMDAKRRMEWEAWRRRAGDFPAGPKRDVLFPKPDAIKDSDKYLAVACVPPKGWELLLGPTMLKEAEQRPVRPQLPEGSKVFYWVYKKTVYETSDPDLTPEDALALINEAQNRRRLQLEKAHALQAMTADLDVKGRRQPVPRDVKIAVWQRDGGRCVECQAKEDLEFDHIIPLAMGGANSLRNLQLMCGTCNRRKGATLG